LNNKIENRELYPLSGKLTPHITVKEYACPCGCGMGRTPETIEWDILRAFETIRLLCKDYPFRITSAWRCGLDTTGEHPEWTNYNHEVGGAANSAHTRGTALDIIPVGRWDKMLKVTGLTRNDVIHICEQIIGDGGVGRWRYGDKGIIHIDRDEVLMNTIGLTRRW